MSTTTTTGPAAASRGTHSAALVLGVTALLALVVAAFAWPASQVAPRHLPVVVVGPLDAAFALQQATAHTGPDPLDVTAVESRAAAVAAIEDREAYAAVVPGPEGTELLTASAASPAVAQALQQLTAGLAAADPGSPAPTTTDVVPLPPDDPRGLVFNAGSLPIVLGGLLTGAVVALRVRGGGAQVVTALGIAVAGGLAVVAVLQGWLGALAGNAWANAGVVALGVAATGLALVGLHRVLGLPGLGAGAALVLLLGNPLSGVTTAPELLPGGWSTLGQLLPPGATGTALRSTAFFEGNGAAAPLLVLGCWALAGAALALLPGRAPRREAAPEVVRAEPAGVR
jgi:hypothetical protein